MTEPNTENNQPQTAEAGQPVDVLSTLAAFGDIKLRMKVLLGSIKMPIGQYLKITRGSIVELGKPRGATLDILVNERKVAEGEVTLTNESDKIGIEVVKVHKPRKY